MCMDTFKVFMVKPISTVEPRIIRIVQVNEIIWHSQPLYMWSHIPLDLVSPSERALVICKCHQSQTAPEDEK